MFYFHFMFSLLTLGSGESSSTSLHSLSFHPKNQRTCEPHPPSSCKKGGGARECKVSMSRLNTGGTPAESGNSAKSLSHNTPSHTCTHTRGLRSEARVVHPHLATWASPGGGVEFPTDGLLATVVCLWMKHENDPRERDSVGDSAARMREIERNMEKKWERITEHASEKAKGASVLVRENAFYLCWAFMLPEAPELGLMLSWTVVQWEWLVEFSSMIYSFHTYFYA